MTEYTETKEDREDAAKLASVDAEIRTLFELKGVAATLTSGRVLTAIEQEVDALAIRRQRIVRESERRLENFYGDRARIKRALKALRAQGFAANMSEPSYESDRTSPAIDAAEAEGTPRAFARKNHVDAAFALDGPAWVTRGTKASDADALKHDLSFYWGPCETTQDAEQYGAAVVAAFEAEGLTVEWGGKVSDTVIVKPSA